MMKYLIPGILIALSIAMFLVFTQPFYGEIKSLKEQSSAYDEALSNSKALEAERDKLTAKYNTISPENLDKIAKMMPDSVDNIRLILEMEKIAEPYGMTLKNIKYDANETGDSSSAPLVNEEGRRIAVQPSRIPYGTWNLSFSTEATYDTFLAYLKDLENNLRLVDISSIDFSAGQSAALNPNLAESYRYQFNLKTYWLKN